MNSFIQHHALRAMRGEKGVGPLLWRVAGSVAEPFYRAGVTIRNLRYDLGGGTCLSRPVISIGNITTGGTGKTPMVRRLAELLRQRGRRPAILMRGYRGDEQLML